MNISQTNPINILNQTITIHAIVEIHNFTKFKKWFKTNLENETLKLNLKKPQDELITNIKTFIEKQIKTDRLLTNPNTGIKIKDYDFNLKSLPKPTFKPTEMAEILTIEQKNIKKGIKSLKNNPEKFQINQFMNCPIINQTLIINTTYQITAPRNFNNFIENHYDNLHLKQFAKDESKTDEITDSLVNQINDFCIHNPILDDKKIGVAINSKPQLKFQKNN